MEIGMIIYNTLLNKAMNKSKNSFERYKKTIDKEKEISYHE